MRTSERRRRPSLLAVSLVTAVACSLLVAVAAGAKPQQPHKKSEVTLRLMTNPGAQAPITVMIANFHRVYPDIKISPEFVPPGQQPVIYQTQFRAGNAPDILQMLPGRGNALGVYNYSDQGLVVDLSGRPWEKRISQPQLVGAKTGKKLWTASMGVSVIGHAYNIDLFKQLGLKPPTTWGELVAQCAKFTAAGKTMFAFYGADLISSPTLMLAQAGSVVAGPDPKWTVKRLKNQVTFANSAWRRVFEQIVEAKNAGCFSPGVVGTTTQSAITSFAKGEAGILPLQSAGLNNVFQQNPNIKVSYLPGLPDKASDTRVAFQPSWAAAVNATISPEKKEAALKFIDFIQRPKQTETYDRASGLLLSGYVLKTGKFPDWTKQYLETVGPLITKGRFAIQLSALWPTPESYTAMAQGFAGLFTGQKTVDQILADMDAGINKAIGR